MRRRSPSNSTTGRRRAIDRLRAGTPPVLSMAALDAALDVCDGVDMLALRERSIALSEDFIRRIEAALPRASAGVAARSRAAGLAGLVPLCAKAMR